MSRGHNYSKFKMTQVVSELDSITEKLDKTNIPKEDGVSFAGLGLTWDNANDVKDVVNKINDCSNMEYLNLEGNTLGVNAAEAISNALENQSAMKKALWKDMFTGRKKDEIPIALKHLSIGLMKAGAKLEVLDLSDNASGPIGAEGIVDLLSSPTCYTLKELKLNNMGLGITGAKMLAEALKDCYKTSKAAGQPLALKVFIAGRNRLENEGATALAEVFEEMGSLEVFQVPQNGIYHEGVQALSKAFARNPNLREINLNDNTLTPEGSFAISKSIGHLQNLVKLDLGDCLMKTQGAHYLAEALQNSHPNLKEVIVSFNSINIEGGLAIFEALSKKENFEYLFIDGNKFGEGGIELLKEAANNIGKINSLGSLSEDEGSESEETETDGEYSDEKDSEEEDSADNYNKENGDSEDNDYEKENIESGYSPHPKTGSADEFLQNPTENNLDKLGDTAVQSIVQEIKTKKFDTQLDELMKAIIKVSGLLDPTGTISDKNLTDSWIMTVCEELYEVLFHWAEERNSLQFLNNTLPVYLGLIKDEETRKPLKNSRLGGCRLAVKYLLKQNSFPDNTKGILEALIDLRI